MSILSKKVTALRALLFGVIITAILFAAEFLLAMRNENQVSAASRPGDLITLAYDGSGRDNLAFYYDVDGYWGTTHYYRIAGSHLVFCAEVDAGWAVGPYRVIQYVNSNEFSGVRKDDLIKLMLYIWENRNTEPSAVSAVFSNWISGGQGSYQSFELDGLTYSGYLDEYYAFTHAIVGHLNDGHYMYDMPQWRINNAESALASLINSNDGVWQRAKSKVVFGAVPVEGGDKQLVVWLEDKYSLETTAVDNADEDKFVENGDSVTIKDTVEYIVEPNTTYTLKGVLMDKTTGEPVIFDGVAVEGSTEISTIDEEGHGTAIMNFTFDASDLAGRELVVFERLYLGDDLLFEHADLSDEGQTVTVISLGTTAVDDDDEDKFIVAGEQATIRDTVEYCATPNTYFIIRGYLVDKATGEPLLVDGNMIVEKAAVRSESGCGTKDLLFTLDTSELGGKEIVVFEELKYDEEVILEHADVDDEAQTVTVISLGTTAVDNADGDKYVEIIEGEQVVIKDTIEYCATPNTYFIIRGYLVDKATGEPILVKGNKVVEKAPVRSETGCGTKDLLFTLDASELGGKEIVVFEELKYDEKVILEHADVNDEAQTVRPISLRTYATNKATGDKLLPYGEDVVINDRVYYCLMVGEEYTIKGILMNQETGEPILINGKPITDEVTFTPEENCCGEFDMTYKLNTGEIDATKLVIFENLYHGDELIIEHINLDNYDESLELDPATIPNTGYPTKEESGIKAADNYAIIFAGISAIAFIGLGVITFKYMKD